MNSLNYTKNVMRTNKLFAKKSFGQNFLIDDTILLNIVKSADVKESDVVIEIGPGLGNLTHYILEKGAKVFAFEIDEDMVDMLNERFNTSNLQVIKQDILKVDLEEYIGGKKVKVIANLPYYITTPIIFKLLEYKENIQSITIMIQKEVAERMTSKPHTKDYGALTINTNIESDVRKLFDVPNTSFIPAPKVTSSVVQIVPNSQKQEQFNIKDKQIFNELVKKAFASRRKKLANSLYNSNMAGLSKEQIEQCILKIGQTLNCRAEELSLEEYVELSNEIVRLR